MCNSTLGAQPFGTTRRSNDRRKFWDSCHSFGVQQVAGSASLSVEPLAEYKRKFGHTIDGG